MGLYTVLQHPHLDIYSTCLSLPAKLVKNKSLFVVLVLIISDYYFLAAFGRFAPYLERRCVRFATPAVSRVPRTM